MEDRTESPLAQEIRKFQERTASLIVSEFGDLRTHIQETEKRLSARFDSLDAELDMSAELIQAALRAAVVRSLR